MLSVSIETTRTNNVPAEIGALPTALAQVRGSDVDAIAAENAAWWKRWWETGATIELGPRRQTLERFWCKYCESPQNRSNRVWLPLMASVCVCARADGQQYMLGSMSRPCLNSTKASSGRCRDGATVPGLLGPWSMMNPVGWCDRLTLDYNVEANCTTDPTTAG